MSYHCDKLCSGPCCEPLRWAIAEMGRRNDVERASLRLMAAFTPLLLERIDARLAITAISDPAKLAELGAMALRARGITIELLSPRTRVDYTHTDDPPCGSFRVVAFVPPGFTWRIDIEWAPGDGLCHCMTLPEFRTLLARIMATPADESSREQAERLIRGDQ